VKTKKQFGQHWLRSERILNQIMTAAAVTPTDRVLEIGPGMGVLTNRLVGNAEAVVAVEIDRDLCAHLVKKMGNIPNFLLLQGDFLRMDIAEQLQSFPPFQHPRKVVANIPYNITGPILEKLLGTIAKPNPQPFQSITLLVQKEVADRLTAKPDSKAFGAMTVRVQYQAECRLVCPVAAKDFSPPPKVDSAVIQLIPRSFSPAVQETAWLDRLVRLGFSSRRKMLRNNLQGVRERKELEVLFGELGFNPDVRAENLSVEQWVELSNRLENREETALGVGDPPKSPLGRGTFGDCD
jgi:16S rRNA (adenine1518-N6/adenine1519-N6)-dimethyltransferase